MSLKGSFETIALPEVMALLASSSKSGELRVVGGHLEGRLWLEDGRLVGSNVGKAHDHVEAIFELLCLTEGNFVFTDGVAALAPEEATAVEPVVRQAEERLQEWRDIERIVPSLEHRVRLVPDLPTPEVTLTADQWRLVMAIALAGTVRGALDELSLSHFEGCRGIRRLVDLGLVLVEPPHVRHSSADPARVARRSVAGNGSQVPPDGAVRTPRLVRRPSLTLENQTFEDPALEDPALEHPTGGPAVEHPTPAEPVFVSASAFSLIPPADHGSLPEEDTRDLDVVYFPARGDGDDLSSFAAAPKPPAPSAFPAPWEDVPVLALPDTEMGAAVAAAAAAAAAAASARAAIPAADAPTGRASRPTREPPEADPINRGLLLKFLSSVRS